MRQLKISTGRSVFRSGIKQQSITVDELFKKLSLPDIRADKDGPYFIFASFKEDKRSAANVEFYYGATIDLDNTPLTIKEVQDLFSKYKYCIYTTHNHKAPGKGLRYRLVLPYRKPQSPERHVQTMLHLMHELGVDNVDTSSKALSRPMYLPSCPKRRQKYFQFVQNDKARLYNPDTIKIDPSLEWERQEEARIELEPLDVNADVEEGDRNNSIARFTGKLIKNGMDLVTATKSAQIWNKTNLKPPLSRKDVKVIVDSVYNSHKRNSGNTGWGFDELIRQVKESKRPKEDYDLFINLISGSHDKLKQSQQERLIRLLRDKTDIPLNIVRSELSAKIAERKGEQEEQEEINTQKSIKELTKEFKNWVYLRRDHKYYNCKNGVVYKPEGFNSAYSSHVEKGSIGNLLLKFKGIKQADMLEFNPGEDKVFKRDHITYANTYIPPEIFPMPGSVRPMLKHFKYLIPDRYERNIILDYIAFVIQNPGKKIRWMPIIKGIKGIGKSIIAELIIAPLIGAGNFKPVDSKAVKRDFNSWQLDAQIICFHELKIGDTRREKKELTDSLKSFIADPTITAHRKGVDEYTVINKSNVIAFTNHEDAIMITEDERRFCMVRSEVERKPNEYYQELIDWLKNNKEEMLNFFDQRDISEFNHITAPETEYTLEVKQESHMWPQGIIIDAMKDKEHPFNKVGVMTWRGIVEYIRANSTGKDLIACDNLMHPTSSSGYLLTNTLRELGFRKYINPATKSERLYIDGKQTRVWISPGNKAGDFKKRPPRMVQKLLQGEKLMYDFDDD